MKSFARLWVFVAALALSTSSFAGGWTQWARFHNTIAEFNATTTASTSTGLVTLPSWMSISCATTGRTTQTSASTIVKGLGANAARARNTGSGWGLSVESARTQVAKTSQLDGTWGLFTGATYALTTGPDGANTAALLGDPGGSIAEVFKSAVFTISAGSAYTFSVWSGPSSRSSGSDFTTYTVNQTTPRSINTAAGAAAAWSRVSSTFTADAGGSGFDVLPCAQAAGNTGSVAVGEVQLELGSYPTSLVPNASGASLARAADVLIATPAGAIAPGGFFSVDFTFAPNYANTEQASDDVLLYFDANDQIFLQQSTGKIVERIGGSGHDVLSSALTWSREDAIRVVASHKAAGLSLAVYKNGSQQGTTQSGSAQSAISLPASIGILGNGTTTAESADLRAFTAFRR